MEQENRELQAQMLENVTATETNEKEISRRLDLFEKVRHPDHDRTEDELICFSAGREVVECAA